jgi:hypothetical protein
MRVEFRAERLINVPARLGRLTPILRNQIANALNKTGDALVHELAHDLALEANLNPEQVRSQMRIQRASYQRLEFRIDASNVERDSSNNQRLPGRSFGSPQQPERFFRQGQLVKIISAEDDSVCDICRALTEGRFTAVEARSLVPAHPNCRCTVAPINPADNQPQGGLQSRNAQGVPLRRGGTRHNHKQFLDHLKHQILEGAGKAVLAVKNG